MRIKGFLNNTRWLLYNLFIRKLLLDISIRHTIKGTAVFFVLKDNTSHRYFLNLCHFLIAQNVEVIIRPSFGFLGHWQTSEFVRQLPQARYAFICKGKPVVISDDRLRGRNKTLRFDYFAYVPQNDSYQVPMSMVDTMYYYPYHREANVLCRNLNRNIKVFYAGNCAATYNNPTIRQKFGLLDRASIIKILKSLSGNHACSGETIRLIADGQEQSDLLILDRNEHPIPPHGFLKLLSQCSFIVVPPGVVMPQTHFIVEGMSVGCIPILQYRKMFYPPLEHMENCFYFNDETDLEDIVRLATNMSQNDVAKLRSRVLDYYTTFLTPASVVKKVLDPAVNYIYLNAEAESVELI